MSEQAPPPPPDPPPPAEPPQRPSFEAVYKQHASYVWRTLRRLGVAQRDCEEATQDAFMIVARFLPEYEERGFLRAWLTAIARNVATRYRAQARPWLYARELESPGVAQEILGATAINERARSPEHLAEVRELVLRVLEEIEPKRRLVLIMHDLDGQILPEIALALGIPWGTAASRLRRARQDFMKAHARLLASGRGSTKILLGLSTAALLDVEREIPPLPPGARERIFTRLSDPLALLHADRPTPGVPVDAAPVAVLKHGAATISGTKAALGGVSLFVLGGVVGALLDPLHRARSSPVALAPSAAITMAAGIASGPAPASNAPAPSPAPAVSAGSAASASPVDDVAAERALMSKAGSALASGNTAAVLDAVQEHARRFRGGRLVEERETYWIAALLHAGRTGEARGRLERLARSYPRSARLPELRKAAGMNAPAEGGASP